MKRMLFIACLLSSNALAAEIYRCTTSSGKFVFSDAPCTADQKSANMTINTPRAQQSTDEATQAKKRLSEAATSMYTTRRQGELNAVIRDTEYEIASLQRNMDLELSVLKKRMGHANNNLAGATWQQSIVAEMQSVTSQYEMKIKNAQSRLQSAKDELSKL